MSQPRRKPRKAGKSHQPEVPSNYKKPLLWVAGISLVLSVGVGVMFTRQTPQRVLYAQDIEVFRMHGCRCVFDWARSLRQQGFRVLVYEQQHLETVRARLRTPENFKSCHVGVYLGYFLEGHVGAGALVQATSERPSGIGLATVSTVNRIPAVDGKTDEASDVMLVGKDGRARPWFIAPKPVPEKTKPAIAQRPS